MSDKLADQGVVESTKDKIEQLLKLLPELPFDEPPVIDKVTGLLGSHNPFAKPADPETSIIWLLDNTAYQPQGHQQWQIELVAAYFVRYSGKEESEFVEALASALGLAEDKQAKETMKERLLPFVHEIAPARTVEASIAGGAITQTLGPSDNNGISKNVITLPDKKYRDGQALRSTVTGIAKNVPGDTMIAAAEGFAVISDIDDTIKVTMTNAPLGILKTTFVEEPQPVDGMPEFYKSMHEKLHEPPFWYLSASPYNLYPFLHEFRDTNYPTGTILLRDASWRNLASFLSSLTKGVKEYKVDNMDKLYKSWPRRKMICVGDSTQSDPEAYGEMYRKHPEWIKAIWIRQVDDVKGVGDVFPGQSQEERNKPERFEKAFKDVPSDVWHVFTAPTELDEKLNALLSKDPLL